MRITMDTSGDFHSPRLEEALLDINVEKLVAALQKDMLTVWKERGDLWAELGAPGVVYFDSDRNSEDVRLRFSIREVVRDLLSHVPKKLDGNVDPSDVRVTASELAGWSKLLAKEARKLERAAKALENWEKAAPEGGN